jgi:hypothetical protein
MMYLTKREMRRISLYFRSTCILTEPHVAHLTASSIMQVPAAQLLDCTYRGIYILLKMLRNVAKNCGDARQLRSHCTSRASTKVVSTKPIFIPFDFSSHRAAVFLQTITRPITFALFCRALAPMYPSSCQTHFIVIRSPIARAPPHCCPCRLADHSSIVFDIDVVVQLCQSQAL